MRLAEFERRWLATIFETVLPTGSDERFDIEDGEVDRYIVHLMAGAPGHFALGLRACTWIVHWCPLLVLGRVSTFGGLATAERVELLTRFGRARHPLIGELPLLFKMSACLGMCGLPAVQARIGISPTDCTPPSWSTATVTGHSGRRELPTLSTDPTREHEHG